MFGIYRKLIIACRKFLITTYFWSLTVLGFLGTTTACVISYPFVDQKTFSRIYESVFCKIVLAGMTWTGLWSFKISGNKSIMRGVGRYIFVANHCSFIDTLLVGTIPYKKKFIMARIFAKIPIFGWLCRTAGNVLVDDKDRSTTEPAVDLCLKTMRDGCSFMVYPEGKRSPDPYSLLKFKTGAFRIAQRTGIDIVPLVLKGTGKGMRIGGVCDLTSLEIVIGTPIQVGPDRSDIDTAIDKVRHFIQPQICK